MSSANNSVNNDYNAYGWVWVHTAIPTPVIPTPAIPTPAIPNPKTNPIPNPNPNPNPIVSIASVGKAGVGIAGVGKAGAPRWVWG